MAIIRSATSGSTSTYSLLEDDVYPARIVKVVFLGSQPQRPYKGKEKPDAVKARITYEVIGEVITQTRDGESKELIAQISETLTVPKGGQSMGKMASLLKTVIGRDETFADTDDYRQLLNKEVNVQVDSYSTDRGKFNGVKSVTALGNKAKANLPEAQLTEEFFCPYTNSDEMKLLWSQMAPWQQDIIKKASDKQYIPAISEGWPTEEVKADEEANEGDEF